LRYLGSLISADGYSENDLLWASEYLMNNKSHGYIKYRVKEQNYAICTMVCIVVPQLKHGQMKRNWKPWKCGFGGGWKIISWVGEVVDVVIWQWKQSFIWHVLRQELLQYDRLNSRLTRTAWVCDVMWCPTKVAHSWSTAYYCFVICKRLLPVKKWSEVEAIHLHKVSKVKQISQFIEITSLPGNHMPIWNHRHLLLSWLYPSRSWYSIKRPQRDARLSWPGWWLNPKIVYLPKMVTYLRKITWQCYSWELNRRLKVTSPVS